MKRKAILIEASDVSGQTDIPGARTDIRNWKNYLLSDLGGSWSEYEIVTLKKPWSHEVEAHLKVDADCYCFVAFSGHGCEGSIVLNDSYHNYPIANLKPKTSQATLIVDSCRGIEEAESYDFSGKTVTAALANASDGRIRILNGRYGEPMVEAANSSLPDRHREVWWNALRASRSGVVQMFSCAKGQAAGEDPTAGGFYTSLLLQSVKDWQSFSPTYSKTHTTKDAHDFAAAKLAQLQQNPEYLPSWLSFPFGVKV